MPRSSNRKNITEGLHQRTELAIKLAFEWMEVMNSSQRGLAARIGVDQSVLSRFLSQQPGYEPLPSRPRLIRVLEQIEAICSHLECVAPVSEDQVTAAADDMETLFRSHLLRTRHLRQHFSPPEVLSRIGELCAQAVLFPPRYRVYACNNVLFVLSNAIFRDQDRVGSRELLESSLARVRELEHVAIAAGRDLECEEAERSAELAATLSYAAVSRAHAALRLEDEDLLATATGQLLEATKHARRPQGGAWRNALQFVEHLLAIEHPEAKTWSERALERALEDRSEALRVALHDKELGLLRAHWPSLDATGIDEIMGGSR